MKKTLEFKTFILLAFLLTLPHLLKAESIFLQNGGIIEANIEKETNESIEIKLENGLTTQVPREQIIRILFNTDYKNKVNLYFHNGDVVEGYIVEEDANFYTYRTELKTNTEVKVNKSEIKIVTAEKINLLQLGLKIQIGSGSFGSVGLTAEFYGIELLLSGGILYIPKKDEDEASLGFPIKLQLAYNFLDLGFLSPYVFGAGLYGVSVKNYHSQFGVVGGLGLVAFDYFFIEGGFLSVFKKSGFALGFGLRLPLKTF